MSIPDLKGLLETAQRIQSEVARVREELARKTVEGETGGGLCRCTVNGRGEVLSLTIDPVDRGRQEDDRGSGGRRRSTSRSTRARELAEADLSRATGGLPLPPGLFGG